MLIEYLMHSYFEKTPGVEGDAGCEGTCGAVVLAADGVGIGIETGVFDCGTGSDERRIACGLTPISAPMPETGGAWTWVCDVVRNRGC